MTSNRLKYKPTLNLNSILQNRDHHKDELKNASSVYQLFHAYSSESKNIYWTSLEYIKKIINNVDECMDNKIIIIINLITENDTYISNCTNKNIKYFHIPIEDNFTSGKIITNNFNKIIDIYKIWNNSNSKIDMIFHCKMGIHRSFSIATLLSMFLYHKKNSPRDYIPKDCDYYSHVDKIQSSNKFIFEPTSLTNNNIEYMYKLFITC